MRNGVLTQNLAKLQFMVSMVNIGNFCSNFDLPSYDMLNIFKYAQIITPNILRQSKHGKVEFKCSCQRK